MHHLLACSLAACRGEPDRIWSARRQQNANKCVRVPSEGVQAADITGKSLACKQATALKLKESQKKGGGLKQTSKEGC